MTLERLEEREEEGPAQVVVSDATSLFWEEEFDFPDLEDAELPEGCLLREQDETANDEQETALALRLWPHRTVQEGMDEDTIRYGAQNDQNQTLSNIDSLELPVLIEPVAPYCQTSMGRIQLMLSVGAPPTELDVIRERQNGVKELLEDGELNEAINVVLSAFDKCEGRLVALIKYANPSFGNKPCDFKAYIALAEDLHHVRELVEALPPCSSPILAKVREELQSLTHLPIFHLPTQDLYYQKEVVLKGELNRTHPRFRYRERMIEPCVVGGGAMIALGVTLTWGGVQINSVPLYAGSMIGIVAGFMSIVGGLSTGLDGSSYDKALGRFLAKQIKASQGIDSFVEAMGRLDELSAIASFGREYATKTVFPEFISAPTQTFRAVDLVNPILATRVAHPVPNSVTLVGGTPLVFTGPNSGGKTSLSKAIVQTQILAQLGAPVFASELRLTPARFIAYQIPTMDSLSDEHGRFGSELKATRDIFCRAVKTPDSLVILDELAQGTTHHESLEMASAIIEGFSELGVAMTLVTQDLALAHHLEDEGISRSYQVEFLDGEPTHRFIPGIATSAEAQAVARQIGFSIEDIKRMIRERP